MLEAMLMQKPVVASRIRGTEELVVESSTGSLFLKGNSRKLAACLMELLSSSTLRKEMGRAGSERVLTYFSIEKYVDNVQNVLSEVLEAKDGI